MKRRLIAFVGIFCIPVLIVSGAYAQKPDNPGQWIEFTGALEGGEYVKGCCGNDGPFPPYHYMCLDFPVGSHAAGTCYDGYLFINGYRDGKYIVEFWTGADWADWPPGENDVAIKIIGGVIVRDRRTKTLTVTFTDEPCVDIYTGEHIAYVSFTLVRHPY